MRTRHLAVLPHMAGLLTTALALVVPRPAAAEKLPVDCSGRRASCYEKRSCTLWSDHVCTERTTEYWYWYYSETKPA